MHDAPQAAGHALRSDPLQGSNDCRENHRPAHGNQDGVNQAALTGETDLPHNEATD
jgi:hypothetical protein